MKNLLLTGAFNYTDAQFSDLKNLGYQITFVQDERERLEMDVTDFHGVVCNNLFLYNEIERFTSLQVIQLTSAGLDRLPMDYIHQKGIQVFNAKGVYSIPMAEWVILKILEIYKKSSFFYEKQRNRRWEKNRDILELTGKTVSIIGLGSVGHEVAKRLRVFGVHIIGVDLSEVQSGIADDYISVDRINDALRKSDIVVLCLPLFPETRHFIDKYKIAAMKEQAVLINVSRGGIINEADLVDALNMDKFLGVALDVFEEEPLNESPLWDFGNVIITPHNSFLSDRISDRLFQLVCYNLTHTILEVPK